MTIVAGLDTSAAPNSPKPADPPRLSVIIPNWNGLTHLDTCLSALRRQSERSIEVIVADNASSDGSQAFIASYYPEVIVLALPVNRGFTGACNAGLRAAHGAILALLNNDTEVDPYWAAEVLAAFDRHPEAGSVASKMRLFDQRDHLHTTGDLFQVNGVPVNRGVWQADLGQFDTEGFVFSACGGSAAYRRPAIDQVGLLDDSFFFSLEDVDLGWRLQLAGWKCVYAPRAIVYHRLAATGGGTTASYYDGRNLIYVLAKDYPAALWRKHGAAILRSQGRQAWRAIRAWRGAAARSRLRGMLSGLVHIPWLMVTRRRAVQASRRIPIADLEAALSPAE